MPCTGPLTAWQDHNGTIRFHEGGDYRRQLELPCGRCTECRLSHARQWAIRCVHEAKMHDHNHFVTLTYEDKNWHPSLNYRDVQLWLKRLRKRLSTRDRNEGRNPRKIRFFAAGEYGDETWRPHYHVLMFNTELRGLKRWDTKLYSSEDLDATWTAGRALAGELTWQTAAYVCKYAFKKRRGDGADAWYRRVDPDTGEIFDVTPEHAHMSGNPAIGKAWFDKYWRDVYAARDGVVIDGKTLPAPRYYDKLLKRIDEEHLLEKQLAREENGRKHAADNTPERRAVRDLYAREREKQRKRNKI